MHPFTTPMVHCSVFFKQNMNAFKALLMWSRKDQGQPCKQGERADATGCIPASGETFSRDTDAQKESADTSQNTTPTEQQERKSYERLGMKEPVRLNQEVRGTSDLDKTTKKILASLSKEQKESIKKYTALDSARLNKVMRSCAPDFKCVEGEDRKMMETMLSVIDQAGAFEKPEQVFRGISLTQDNAKTFLAGIEACMKDDSSFRMPSITSTSIDLDTAFLVGSSEKLIPCGFSIIAKKGLYVESISSVKGEYEVLLSPTSKYKVVSVSDVSIEGHKEQGYAESMKMVYLEEI